MRRMRERPSHRERRKPGPMRSPRAARPRRPWLPLLAAGAIGAALLLAWLRSRPASLAPSGSGTFADSLEAMEPRAALIEGTRLGNAGLYSESLPYLRRGVAGLPLEFVGHLNLSSSLTNVAIEVRRAHMDRAEPAMRSSYDRIGSVLAGDRELDRALERAGAPQQRAMALMARATYYDTWGMPGDALAWARLAAQQAPQWPAPAALARKLAADLARGGLAR